MADQTETPPNEAQPAPARKDRAGPTSLGIYDRPKSDGLTEIEWIAIGLSGLWLLGSAIFFLVLSDSPAEGAAEGTDPLRFTMTMLAIFMPVAMIWVAATAARASRVMREESQRLQTAIDAIRHSYIAQQQGDKRRPETAVARKLDEIAAAARKTESTLATFQSQRETPRTVAKAAPAARAEDQPTLALGTPAEDMPAPLSTTDFIRALNFPETAEDKEGFTALRRALKDRAAAQLIQAAQDVLTLMSHDGIYMDDLSPDRARPELWRQFAQGARGRTIAPLGGIRDRSSLALTHARMKQDPIFRDAAHHFLRRFDRTFAQFEKEATDSEISALADTRTARAFMILGRVAGTFD